MKITTTVGALVLALAAPFAAEAAFIYGIDDSNILWEINPKAKTNRSLLSTGLTTQSNAFAFDTARGHMFFLNRGGATNATNTNNMYQWNSNTNAFNKIADGSALGIAGITVPANAAYYNNAYWFFKERTSDLLKVSMGYSGPVPEVTFVETFTPTLSLPAGSQNAFGDIAIDPNTGTLYAYTAQGSGGDFYSLDLSGGTVGGFNLIKAGGSAIGLQISFDETFTTLYGHNYNDGKWYEVDTATGALTDLDFASLVGNDANGIPRGLRDVGGSALAQVPEPGSSLVLGLLSLVGCAAAARRMKA